MATRVLEALLRRERIVIWGALAVLTILAWTWVLLGAGTGMHVVAMTTWQFPPPRPAPTLSGEWSVAYWLTMVTMWWVMMIAMMVPSAAPFILLHARVARHGRSQGEGAAAPVPTAAFAAGYLVCWLVFSLLATALQFALERSGLVHAAMMWSTDRWLTSGLLILAGLYQLSRYKTACLVQCRSPARFLAAHWRSGRVGAFRLGVLHGTICVGCCWALMLLLFAAGVMNLVWIAGLSIVVLAEKLAPFGASLAKPLGFLLLLGGVGVGITS